MSSAALRSWKCCHQFTFAGAVASAAKTFLGSALAVSALGLGYCRMVSFAASFSLFSLLAEIPEPRNGRSIQGYRP